MVIGRHEPKQAKHADLKQAVRIGLDEAFASLIESFHDLTDERFWAFPLPNRHNIVTLAEHCLQGLDLYACEVQFGKLTFEPEGRFDIWHYSPEQLRPKMVNLPIAAKVVERLEAVRRAAVAHLDAKPEEDLFAKRPGTWWTDEFDKTCLDAYLRATWHVMTHVRQIWLLRGLLGLTDADGWPQQHWA